MTDKVIVLSWRWALTAMIITTIFWMFSYFINGSVPVLKIYWQTGSGGQLLNLSRWMDIAFAPLCTFVVVALHSMIKDDALLTMSSIFLFIGSVVAMIIAASSLFGFWFVSTWFLGLYVCMAIIVGFSSHFPWQKFWNWITVWEMIPHK